MRSQSLMGVRLYKQKAAPTPKTVKPAASKSSASKTPQPTLVGKLHAAVVDPSGTYVVGFMVKQPDIAGMVKRPDVFVGLAPLAPLEDGSGLLVPDEPESFDKPAAASAQVDLDLCVIWEGMDAKTRSGRPLGYVRDLEFADKNGELQAIFLTEGGMSDALVGALKVPMADVVGYQDQCIVLKEVARSYEREGGAAAVAGEAAAKAQVKAAKAGATAAQATGKAVKRGARELGKLVGKAKRGVVEATQTEPDYKELPAQDVEVSPINNDASVKKSTSAAQSKAPTAKVRQNTTQATKAQTDKRKPATTKKSAADQLAKGLGKSLRSTKGMFSSFKKEFDKYSKLCNSAR